MPWAAEPLLLLASSPPRLEAQAGKQSVGQKDPHYNTNYRAGKATFADRDRKIRKSLGEAFQEALRSAKSLVTPERAAAGAAAGAGLAYVGSRAARGFKSGKQEKRQQGMAHGYEDAFKQRREAFDASFRRQRLQLSEQGQMTADSQTPRGGPLRRARLAQTKTASIQKYRLECTSAD